MQNIQEDDLIAPPSSKMKPQGQIKTMSKIINNRYLNQNIYNLFLQKRYQDCINLINKCKIDQFKLYIRALIDKQQFKLQSSLNLLNQCQIMDKLNCNYLKAIAKNFYLMGKYKSSLEVAKDAYKLNSNQPQIFYIMGKISLALNDPGNAITHFESSINKQPNQQSYIQLAKIQIQRKQYSKAASTIKNAFGVSIQNSTLYQLLGQIYIKSDHPNQALNFYKEALQRDGNSYNSLFSAGALIQANGQITQAIDYYNKAYKLSPNSATLWNNVGLYMLGKKKAIAAYSCFKRALYLDPFKWEAHLNLAIVLMENKKYLSAHIHIRSALQMKKDAYLFNLLGICLSSLGDFNNAGKAFEQSLALDNNDQVRYNLLVNLLKLRQKEKVKQHYNILQNSKDTKVIQKIKSIKKYVQK